MIRKMFRNNTLVFLFILGWNILPAQSNSLNTLSDALSTFEKHYVYPSVLRALVGQQDESFNELIKDIRYLRILKVDSSFVLENDSLIQSSLNGITTEGFEYLASMDDKESTNEFFVLEKEERIEGFLINRKEPYSYLMIELVGDLHLNKLTDLMNMDYTNFSLLFE